MVIKEKRGVEVIIMDWGGEVIIEDVAECVIINDRKILLLERSLVVDQVNKREMEMKDEYGVIIKRR